MLKHRLVSPILMWLIVFFGAGIIFLITPLYLVIEKSDYTNFIFAFAGLYWLYFFTNALAVHRRAPLSVAGIDKLVTSGVYALVRHPIYSADMVLAWGIFFFYPYLWVLLSVIWMNLVLFFWMKLEEKALIEKFGSEYLEYKKKVPMVIPKL